MSIVWEAFLCMKKKPVIFFSWLWRTHLIIKLKLCHSHEGYCAQEKPFLMYVENLEMNDSPKWLLFIKVNGQVTSDTLWKQGEVFLLRIWRIVLFLRVVVNILIQAFIIFRYDCYWARWSSHSWSLGCLWLSKLFDSQLSLFHILKFIVLLSHFHKCSQNRITTEAVRGINQSRSIFIVMILSALLFKAILVAFLGFLDNWQADACSGWCESTFLLIHCQW